MAAPIHLAADYLRAFQALFPRGRVWPRDADAVQAQFLGALSPTYERQHLRANALLVDAFPATADELLPEWEETLGLPDPCAGPAPTLQLRRSQVVARLTGRGGQSVAYFVAVAARLGYTITVTQFAPFRAGLAAVGMPLCGEAWAHAWQVNAPLNTVTYFSAGQSAVGEPLASWGNEVLECELTALKPAHTALIFAYA